MNRFREGDRIEGALSDSEADRGELIDANRAAERRLVENRTDHLECEHFDDKAAEDEFVNRAARLLVGWKDRNADERRFAMQRIGSELMKVHGAPPEPIFEQRFKDPRVLGEHDHPEWIRINERVFEEDNPRLALSTYLHEYRHHEQSEEVEKSRSVLWHEVDQERAREAQRGLSDYIRHEEDPEGYRRQFIERDARRFSDPLVDRILKVVAALEVGPPAPGDAANMIAGPGDEVARRTLEE